LEFPIIHRALAESKTGRPPGAESEVQTAPLATKKDIENRLHRVLDLQLGENQNSARSGYAAENMATLRRLALNLLKSEKTKRQGIRGKQNNTSWDHAYLLKLLEI
jgi:hypothetical protein